MQLQILDRRTHRGRIEDVQFQLRWHRSGNQLIHPGIECGIDFLRFLEATQYAERHLLLDDRCGFVLQK